MKGVVDRIEGGILVIISEDGEQINIDLGSLGSVIQEGDSVDIEFSEGEVVGIQIDTEAQEASLKRISDKLDILRKGKHLEDE